MKCTMTGVGALLLAPGRYWSRLDLRVTNHQPSTTSNKPTRMGPGGGGTP